MRYNKTQKYVLILTVFMFVFMAGQSPVEAMHFESGEDMTIDCDVTLTYGAGWRVSDRDEGKLKPAWINGDDGNRNFDQWDMINNKATLMADIDFKYKDFGVFVRPKAFYDYVYATDNAKNNTGTNNAAIGGLVSGSDDWADDVEDIHGRDAEILDLFGYYELFPGNRPLNIRIGKQVISWGESFLISGGVSSAQSPVDISAAVAIGTELKEIFLPSEAGYIQLDLTDKLALATYYQWKWKKSKLMEGGTFFASSTIGDALDDIKAPLLAPSPLGGLLQIPRIGDDDAKDNGQYGVALTYISDWLNATELGLYFINYHDKLPTVNTQLTFIPGVGPVPTGYFLSCTEDIKLYGVSFSSLIGDVNVSGEFSYRQDYNFQGAIGPVPGNYWQAQTSWTYARAFRPISDQASTLGEIACVRTIGLGDNVFAWKYILGLNFDWYAVLNALDMQLSLTFGDSLSGTTSPNIGFIEGVSSGAIGLNFTYRTVYKASIKYENRFNDIRNSASDRDTLALTLSYTF